MSSETHLDEEKLLSRYSSEPERERTATKKHPQMSSGILRHQLWRLSILAFLLIASLTCAAIFILLVTQHNEFSKLLREIHNQNTTPSNAIQRKRCGHSAEEARANDCHFDLMLTAWVPRDCFDEPLMESYISNHNYTWYSDKALTTTVPDNVVRRGEHHRVFVEKEFHYVHCAYMWEMQMRAYHAGIAMEYDISTVEHTTHCAHLLVDRVLPRNFTALTVKYDTCIVAVT